MQEINDLKNIVIQSLESKGILSQQRAQIRSSVFKIIEDQDSNETQKKPAFFWENPLCQKIHDSKIGQIALELIHEFFEFFRMDYTNNVFIHESNYKENFDEDELKQDLNLVGDSEKQPLLLNIIQKLLGGGFSMERPSIGNENQPIPERVEESNSFTKLGDDLSKQIENFEKQKLDHEQNQKIEAPKITKSEKQVSNFKTEEVPKGLLKKDQDCNTKIPETNLDKNNSNYNPAVTELPIDQNSFTNNDQQLSSNRKSKDGSSQNQLSSNRQVSDMKNPRPELYDLIENDHLKQKIKQPHGNNELSANEETENITMELENPQYINSQQPNSDENSRDEEESNEDYEEEIHEEESAGEEQIGQREEDQLVNSDEMYMSESLGVNFSVDSLALEEFDYVEEIMEVSEDEYAMDLDEIEMEFENLEGGEV